jgi:hypothetical protein
MASVESALATEKCVTRRYFIADADAAPALIQRMISCGISSPHTARDIKALLRRL